jgi:UDP-N-acetylmuramyl tripeptide synthase
MQIFHLIPYFGPGRRSDRTVVEYSIGFEPRELEFLGSQLHKIEYAVTGMVHRAGLLDSGKLLPGMADYHDPLARFGALSATLVLLFQRRSGHHVSWYEVKASPEKQQCLCLVEHEDSDVGAAAVRLAWDVLSRKTQDLGPVFAGFRKFAEALALPPDSRAIIAAAEARDIPYLKLNRQPFKYDRQEDGDDRSQSQPNGLIQLGYGKYQRQLDGTYCLDTSEASQAFMESPEALMNLLEERRIPHFKPGTKVQGKLYRLLVVNDDIFAILVQDSGGNSHTEYTGQVHESTREFALSISRKMNSPVVVVTVLASDLSRPLADTESGVIDVNPGPVLSDLLPGGSGLLPEIAEQIVAWLFPEGATSRIPMIVITGTNGKTTTTQMVNHILLSSGMNPGMVCTNGQYINGESKWTGDANSQVGHARMLTSKAIDCAAFEAHHRGLRRRGCAFQWCDVGVCLNVSRDHVKAGEINDLDELAGIKRSLPERARKAAVLFADNSYCMEMIPNLTAEKICLVSLTQSAEVLAESASGQCVIEPIGDENGEDKNWIVVYDEDQRKPVIRVNDIPATLNGQASHNVSNAMHAIASSYFLGITLDSIARAMSGFSTGIDLTPGRMNIHDNGRFRVILDFAHNIDGVQKLCSFLEKQEVPNRRIMLFAMRGGRADEEIRAATKETVGHFDVYLIREYNNLQGRERGAVSAMMKDVLLESGISENQIIVLLDAEESLGHALGMLEDGDLLWVKPADKEIEPWWEKIISI